MFKFVAVILVACIAYTSAKPGVFAPVAYSAPLVAAAPVVTATSSQFVARNHNGIAAAPLAYTAPLAYAAAPAAHLAYSAPLAYAAAPAVAAAPLKYTAAAPLLI